MFKLPEATKREKEFLTSVGIIITVVVFGLIIKYIFMGMDPLVIKIIIGVTIGMAISRLFN